ncbi:MAG TPA: MBG domain-containing protein, partial [Thermoanaerobaculia bacterium]|nr:MBG domain-containing protein [Thermoanaerobaculia bacterium]
MRKLAAAIVLLSAAVAQPAFPTSPTQFGEARLMQSDGQQIATFSQCVSIGTSNDIVAIMGGGTGATVEVPGNLHTGDIVCSRAATDDLTLWNWRQDLINGKSSAFVDGKLQLVDPTGAVLLTWTFSHGWPSKIFYNIGSAIITESIALTTDQLSRTGAALVPTITWTPLPLTYGDLLGSSQLNASTTAAGTFTYDPPAGTVLTAGTHTLKATFQPADPTQFQSVTVSADVTVSPALLTARADDVTKVYGSSNPNLTYTLSGFVNGENTSVVSGAPLLSTTATTSSDVGSYPVTISAGTLQAANYTFQFTGGQLSITKADQTIKWAAPAAIVYGTALSSTQLNATVSVVGPALAGALTYSPAAGTVLHAGDQLLTLNVAATNDYNAATASVHLTVLKATPAFSSLSSPIIAKGTAATPLSGTISAKAVSIPAGENVVITLLATSQNAAIQTDGSFSSNFATAALAVSSTPYPVNYNYPGD